MVRGDELRVRLERSDTIMTGRSVEQLTQYYRGLQVWGGSVARQFDGTSLVSVFGTIYQGLDIDVAPAVSRDAARRARSRARAGRCCCPTPNRSWWSCRMAVHSGWPGSGKLQLRGDIVRFFVDAASGQVVRRYSMRQRQAANAAIGHGTGVLGDDKKMSATAVSGTFLASDPLRPPVIVTYDMKGDINRSLNVLINRTPLVTA